MHVSGFLRTANPEREDAHGAFTSNVDDGAFAHLNYGDGLVARLVADGTLRVERRTMADGPPGQVTVTPPSGKPGPVTLTAAAPGRAVAAVRAAEPGVYQVTDGTHTVFAAASVANPQEFADLRATAEKLQPVVRASGGSVRFVGGTLPDLRRTDPGRLAAGNGWIGLPRRQDHVVTGLDAIPLLPPWAALPVLLALVVAAWRREGAG